jgi:uncharacterized membrane protein YuzA (DUF378 family)
MEKLDVFAAVVVVLGGLNLGLAGLIGIDMVATAFGELSGGTRLVYVVVGLSAAYQVLMWKSIQRRWALAWARL